MLYYIVDATQSEAVCIMSGELNGTHFSRVDLSILCAIDVHDL